MWKGSGGLEVAGPISPVTPAVPDQGWSLSLCLWSGWATDWRFAETPSSSRSQLWPQLRGRDGISTFPSCSWFFYVKSMGLWIWGAAVWGLFLLPAEVSWQRRCTGWHIVWHKTWKISAGEKKAFLDVIALCLFSIIHTLNQFSK